MTDLLNALEKLPDAKSIWQETNHKELAFKKQLGQNFLFDENLCAKIAATAPLQESAGVLEIGSGAASLTRALCYELLSMQSTATLFVIEPDDRCLAVLQPLKDIMAEQLQIKKGFAEKQNLTEFLPKNTSVIANLPYNVASVILMKLLDNIDLFNSLTLMFQAEVAKRICASVGSKDYSRLSVAVQFLCDVRNVMILPPHVFTPPPKVDSALVQLLPLRHKKRQASWGALQEILRLSFSTRRKMLRNSLQSLDNSGELLAAAEIDGMRRAETLTIEEFDRLAVCYEKG